MVVNNPNNWHWVDKNCISWAREYFNGKLPGLNTGDKDTATKYAEITSVSSLEGDCEVNQRKGKVISLFDLQVVMLIKGFVGDEQFEGSITVPEVAFDSSATDYQFDISVYKETVKLNEVKETIRANLVPQLRDIFQQFGKDLLVTHGNDIQVPENEVKSVFTKANQQSSLNASKKAEEAVKNQQQQQQSATTSSANSQSKSSTGHVGNTTTIHLEPSFNVQAFEIFNTFIDKERIIIWSRSKIHEYNDNTNNGSQYLMVGDMFDLFDGNITSELLESKLGTKLVLKWRLRDWPANVYSTLDMDFHESEEYHETKVQITWSGIPVGEEDRVRANFENYYVKPIKLTFGFGIVL
ncbi:Aha1p KNAG_0A04470 [Huiozyma naganishii CBS 8797]|uniref:Activator of Hsp90 ATPase AHSA1-like N-terminal domain-containing protein n=1 Tax=Huiozyma naganishii (strain ATCC MYA-139 / BCRC 22969 / CBS 8797 / KCTC 17520 / NBRC 10181 / NCYC 3082 / Yp74L-3) TaxID=1071383 RepID=J7R002_HUIN7|nr:hypothetical protein KNAG_0A04470 [Kazachstania naganishii CBS 8797]CCK68120.1 hypothetical protein KNAG_0A04470 [Kazachstania naganishii CBS 8797]